MPPPERTFLVESYVPHLDERTAAELTSRCQAAVRRLRREGVALRWIRSFVMIDEETYLCVVAARDLDQVTRLNEQAGVEHEHVTEVVAIDP
jgi:Protein of unknown function (DUF4242)